jgi:hypothetical protein
MIALGRTFVLALLAVIGMAVAAAAAELVVIQSTAPRIPAGTIIDAAATLSVPANEAITVVTADGKTQTIEGPFGRSVAPWRWTNFRAPMSRKTLACRSA